MKTLKIKTEKTSVTKFIELDDHETYEIELYYNLGGMNYFLGKTEPRGLWLCVRPVEITLSTDGSVLWTKWTAFAGTKKFLQEEKRFVKSHLDLYARTFRLLEEDNTIIHSDVRLLMDVVRSKEGKSSLPL